MGGRRGFNLLEVILSFFVISIVLIVLINLYPVSQFTLRRGEHQLTADGIAQDRLERARAGKFDALVVDAPPTGDTVIRGGLDYIVTQSVTSVPGVDPDIARQVTVKVQWRERGNRVDQAVHRVYVLNVPQ